MKESRLIMGMPITVEITGDMHATGETIGKIFAYFELIDKRFSVFKEDSEISKINRNELKPSEYSDDMQTIFHLAEKTRIETDGYFNIITPDGKYNPSGIVKGWAIYQASKILAEDGFKEFFIDAGGDIQTYGKYWKIGIRNPIDTGQIIKTVYVRDMGIATSGTYLRGNHIYNPIKKHKPATEIASLTVIGPNVYEADRFATAAFAMGKKGIHFIEKLNGFEGYMVDHNSIATMTTGFQKYENI